MTTYLPQASYCMIHDVDEPVDRTTFAVCRTCGHVYATPQDLVQAYNLGVDWMNNDPRLEFIQPVTPMTVAEADLIGFCQECVHDF